MAPRKTAVKGKQPQDRKPKQPSKSAKKEQEPGLSFKVEGQVYTVLMSELTGIEVKLFRGAVGVSPLQFFSNSAGIDIDIVAGFVWLARRRNEPTLTYEAVAGNMNYNTKVELELPDGVVEDYSDPEL